MRQAEAIAPGGGLLPGKEGEDGAGGSRVIAIIEVPGAWIVEIDGLLDEAHPQHARVEIEVARRRAADRRHMMDARHGEAFRITGYRAVSRV